MKKIMPLLVSIACVSSLIADDTCTTSNRECPCIKERERLEALKNSIKLITPEVFKEKLNNASTTIINVTPEEVRDKHIPGTEKISVNNILEKVTELKWPKNKEIVLYDRRGVSSKKAYSILVSMGYTNVSVVEGGMDIWLTEKPGLLDIKTIPGIIRNYTDDELIAFLLQ
jgi:rhodanese-related sulfurtransferase